MLLLKKKLKKVIERNDIKELFIEKYKYYYIFYYVDNSLCKGEVSFY